MACIHYRWCRRNTGFRAERGGRRFGCTREISRRARPRGEPAATGASMQSTRTRIFSGLERIDRSKSLKDAERIALSVNEVSLPANTRNSELRQCNLSASAADPCCRRIEVCHLHGANEGVSSVLWWRRLRWTLQQCASRPFSLNAPVFNRQSFRLSELPAKDCTVKSHGAAGIVSLNFKIGWRIHHASIIENSLLMSQSNWPLFPPLAPERPICAAPNVPRKALCPRSQHRVHWRGPAPLSH